MNKLRYEAVLFVLFVSGCALDFSLGELELQEFDRTPASVNVENASQVVSCELTIVPQGARTVQYAVCSFVSPGGRKSGCLANSHIANVWSCDATIPADAEENTWTIEYLFAQDDEGGKFFITGAELVGDTAGVLAGDAGRVDLEVVSAFADTDPPTITSFVVAPATVSPGGAATCTLTAVDANLPLKDSGCTFLPDDGSRSVSCTMRGEETCDIDIAADADAGVAYSEVNHFARDKSLNVTIGNLGRAFSVEGGTGGTGGTGGGGGSMTCDVYTPDQTLAAVSPPAPGWFVSPAKTTAYDALTFEVYAKVSSATSDAGFGAMSGPGTPTWGDVVARVRFYDTGTVQPFDGTSVSYKCDDGIGDTTCPVYEANTYYRFVFTVDLAADTFDLDFYDPCDGTADRLAEDFGLSSAVESLDRYGAWEVLGDTLSIVDDNSNGAWTPSGSPPAGSVSVSVAGIPAECSPSWSINPGGYSGGGAFGPQSVSDGDYTITWADSDIDCLIPQHSPTPGQETLTVADDAQTFDLSPENYTVRASRSASVDVQQDGGDCAGDTGCTVFGDWAASSVAFGGVYSDTGTGDASLAPTLRDGRQYSVSFSAESGYLTPSPAGFTAQTSPQTAVGDYLGAGGGGGGIDKDFYVSRSTCETPCGVSFDAQVTEALSWPEVEQSRFIWDFGDGSNGLEGYLSAHVYELSEGAGQDVYTVTLTVDGQTWNTQQITVNPEAGRTICVSSASNFTGCPSVSGGDHFTTVASGYGAASAGDRVLFRYGESYGTYNFTSGPANLTVGAFGTPADGLPEIAQGSSEWDVNIGVRIMDLDIDGSATSFPDGVINARSSDFLLLRCNVHGGYNVRDETIGSGYDVHPRRYYFGNTISSTGTNRAGGTYVAFVGNDMTINGSGTGHALRFAGVRRGLAIGNIFTEINGFDSFVVRGSESAGRPGSDYVLVRGNVMRGAVQVAPQNSGADSELQHVVWENNVMVPSPDDGGTTEVSWRGINGHDMIFRNNIIHNYRRNWSIQTHPLTGASYNIKLLNNTVYSDRATQTHWICTGSCSGGCEWRNNLAFINSNSSSSAATSCPGRSFNHEYWPNRTQNCILPNGSATCTNPDFVSESDYQASDFLLPGAGTPGIDAAVSRPEVWDDYSGNLRGASPDVGAKER